MFKSLIISNGWLCTEIVHTFGRADKVSIQVRAHACADGFFLDFGGIIRIRPVDVARKYRGCGLNSTTQLNLGALIEVQARQAGGRLVNGG
jgi:hypothetical protein